MVLFLKWDPFVEEDREGEGRRKNEGDESAFILGKGTS